LGDLQAYNETEVHDTYAYLAKGLNAIGIAYIHISSNPNIPQKTLEVIRANFKGTLILSNGLTPETGEEVLNNGISDLVAFGRSFLANPDFVTRIERSASLNTLDFTTLYTPGAVGYTDYARL
jgi:N-ethylmaleimide reductase